jgi:hypothetical protein
MKLLEMNMRIAGISILLVMCAAGTIFAEEEAASEGIAADETASGGIGIDVTADFYSKYVWRGQNLVDDWVMQPGATMGFGDFTVGVWGNVDMTNENEEEWNFTEVDYIFDYSNSLTDAIGYSLGYIYYQFPQASGDTYEFYGGLNFETFLSPSITWYYDADEVSGSYVAFGLGHSIKKLAPGFSEDSPIGLDIGLNIGWADSNYNDYYWGVDDSGFNDLTLSVGLPMELCGWSVTPSVSYVTLLDSDIRESDAYDSSSDYIYAGISLGISF